MNIAVRYYSRSGNTKEVAQAIAKAVGVDAISVEKADAQINEPVDVLFIGGALYAYGLDKNMKEYLKTLKKDNVKKAVVFSTSWLSKHSVELIKKAYPTMALRLKPNISMLKMSRAKRKREMRQSLLKSLYDEVSGNDL